MHESPRLGYRGTIRSRTQQVLAKAGIVLGAGIVIASAIAISLVLFAIAAAALCVFSGYFWWKTRHIRRQMRAQFDSARNTEGQIIEGIVIRERIERRDE